MDEEQMLDWSSELALESQVEANINKVSGQNKANEPVNHLCQQPTSPKKVKTRVELPAGSSVRAQQWKGKSSTENVQSPAKLPMSSSRPQNGIGKNMTKNGPSSCEPSNPTGLSSAWTDWIGPSCKEAIKTEPSTPMKTSSGLKRKATSHELQFTPRAKLSPSPGSTSSPMNKKPVDDLFCEICQVGCSSPLTLRQHLIGRPHKAKLEFMKMKRNCTISGKNRKGGPRCDTCQIWCSDSDAMKMHLNGQKHKAKVQELEACKRSGGDVSTSKKPIRCELCKINCMDEDLFKMHLKGRQHATRVKCRGLLWKS